MLASKDLALALLLASFTLCSTSCKKEQPEPENPTNEEQGTFSIAASWDQAGGFNRPSSYRNLHFILETSAADTVAIKLISTKAVQGQFIVLDSKGSEVYSTYPEPELSESPVLSAGKFEIVACADEWMAGVCTLNVTGRSVDTLYQVSVLHSEQSGNIASGGGYNLFNSPRNHQYSFTTSKDNVYIDLSFIASEAVPMQIGLNLNPLQKTYAGSKDGLREQLINKAGTYVVTIAADEYVTGDYSLYLDGKDGEVSALTRIPFETLSDAGEWSSGGGFNNSAATGNKLYSFTVTEDESYIDIVLTTGNGSTYGQLALLDQNMNKLEDTFADPRVSISSYRVAKAGTYKLAVMADVGAVGSFTIDVHGNVAALTEL